MQIIEHGRWRLGSLQISFLYKHRAQHLQDSGDNPAWKSAGLRSGVQSSHAGAQGTQSSCSVSDVALAHRKSIMEDCRASVQGTMAPHLEGELLLRRAGISKLFLGLLKRALHTRCELCSGSWTLPVYWSALEEWEALRPREECGSCPFLLNFKQHFCECLGDRDI